MSEHSSIEWTDATWNPVTGCTKVSPGCDHCYAERITERFHGKGSFARVVLHPERLDLPLRWESPRRVFVNSMSDVFHGVVPRDYIEQVWDVMLRARRHTFQVLTKRAERMERVVRDLTEWFDDENQRLQHGVAANVWLGVSVESPAYYSRIHHLQRTPAAVRFLSCEPLLAALPELPLDGIDWVIVGGESGSGARPMHPAWVRDIRDQCTRAGVAFFFKQWGEWAPLGPVYVEHRSADGCGHAGTEADPCACDDLYEAITEWVLEAEEARHAVLSLSQGGTRIDAHERLQPLAGSWYMERVGKARAGRELDGRVHDAMPLRVVAA